MITHHQLSQALFRSMDTNSIEPKSSDRSFLLSSGDRAVLGLLAGAFLFRWLFLYVTPLDLAGDEAYYWEWGQHLDWGYFSKPPGIAWIMAFADWIGGGTAMGIRTVTLLLGSFALWFLYKLVSSSVSHHAAVWSVLLSISTIGTAALQTVLTIDAPLVFSWTGAMWSLWEWHASIRSGKEKHTSVFLLACFLAIGLLSKQMMLVFYPMGLMWFAMDSRTRTALTRSTFWLVWLLPLGTLLPSVWWNWQHDWITFTHTLHHFESPGNHFVRQISKGFEFLLSQMGLIGLILYPLSVAVIIQTLRKRTKRHESFFLIFGGVPLLFFMAFGFWQRVNPNWPAAFLPACIALLSAKAFGDSTPGTPMDSFWRKWVIRGFRWNVVMVLVCYLLLFVFSHEWLPSVPGDPSARIRGWQVLAEDVESIRKETSIPADCYYVSIGHRFITSELAFYLKGQPRVYRYLPDHDVPLSQHDFWSTPANDLGKDALIIVQGGKDNIPPELSHHFDSVTWIADLKYENRAKRYQRFSVFHGKSLRDWPVSKFAASTR